MRRRACLFFCFAAIGLVTGDTRSQRVLFAKHGDASAHLFGGNVRSAGDVDADGYEDFVSGSPNPNGIGHAHVHSGKDGRLLYRFDGEQVGGFFGVSASGAGDLNTDGYADILVGASSHSDKANKREGMVKVYSGKDGAVLYTLIGYDYDSEFGFSVSGAGDVNNDGNADFIVGAYKDDTSFWDSGSARVFSGKTGALLYTFSGDEKFTSFGLSVSGPGDVNNDGYSDLLVGAPRDDDSGKTDCGSASLYSGKDGTVLQQFFGDSKNDEFGFSVSTAGDLNLDGFLDLIVGAPRDDSSATDSGSVRVLSGKDGTTIYSYDGLAADDWFGWAVTGGGDINADGYSDFIVGALFDDSAGTDAGSVNVYSGKDGSLLDRFEGNAPGDWYGQSLAMTGDLNRDGHTEFIIGAEREDQNGTDSGTVYVMSGKRLNLWTNTQSLPLNAPGQQALTIDFGSAQAGNSYWVFGSFLGMHPGATLGNQQIALIPDSYTRVAIVHTNTPTFAQFRGTLDSTGHAIAFLNIPGGLPAMPSLSLYHAAVAFDASNGAIFSISNSTSLRLHN